jgi:hypothetical protein
MGRTCRDAISECIVIPIQSSKKKLVEFFWVKRLADGAENIRQGFNLVEEGVGVGKSCFLILESATHICITRADDCDTKLASRVSHASRDVGIIITMLITPSEREETIAERID